MLERKWVEIARGVSPAVRKPETARILDLGSGTRGDSPRFGDLGVRVSMIVEFDLNPTYVRQMLEAHPSITGVAGDAVTLPFRDNSFEIVYQSTMLSSLLDPGIRRAVLEEVARVLMPGGVFISYDVRYRNPWNPNTRPLRSRDLKEAFAGWSVTFASMTGIPQILRLLAPVSIGACRVIEGIPPLRTHLLAIARKP